jgi:hypothetical protein
MGKTSRKFNIRSFVALMIAFSGLGLPITGIANHIYGFTPLTLERHIWMSAHNILGLIFCIFSIWHIALNRRPLVGYLKGIGFSLSFLSREAMLAGAIVTVILLFFIGHAFHAGG